MGDVTAFWTTERPRIGMDEENDVTDQCWRLDELLLANLRAADARVGRGLTV
jgi:hypothetical protein